MNQLFLTLKTSRSSSLTGFFFVGVKHPDDPSPFCMAEKGTPKKNISSYSRSYAFIWSASGTSWCSPPRSALTSLSHWTAWTCSPSWRKTALPRPPPTTCCPSSVTTAQPAVSSNWLLERERERDRETETESMICSAAAMKQYLIFRNNNSKVKMLALVRN